MSSSSADSRHASVQARSPAPAVQSASSESSDSEEEQSGSGEDVEAQTAVQQHRASKSGSTAERSSKFKAKPRKACSSQKVPLNSEYKDLLNEVIRDAATGSSYRDTSPLADSQIGGSYWSSTEKEHFFSALAVHGRDGLKALARATATKSELQIREYILLLEQATQNDAISSDFTQADVPAAVEVGPSCEDPLNEAALAIETVVERANADVEKRRFGEHWVIDEVSAQHFDSILNAEVGDVARKTDDTAPGLDLADAIENKVPASAAFFDCTLLLQLSRTLFMNGPPKEDGNWRTLDCIGDVTQEPAVYRSALDDFHDIATILTRKLVHTTLFQATSRLRAKDASNPQPVVIERDVRVAADLLGMRLNWKSYWAKLPRRIGVDVYSETGKYKVDGRTGTKNGVKLTYDEAEAALGLEPQMVLRGQERGFNEDISVKSKVEENGESDSGTDESDSSSDGIIELKAERARRKRKRSISPDSFDRAEDEYVDALDGRAQLAEETMLRNLLRLLPGTQDGLQPDELPERPQAKRKRRETPGNWRQRKSVKAVWEQGIAIEQLQGRDTDDGPDWKQH